VTTTEPAGDRGHEPNGPGLAYVRLWLGRYWLALWFMAVTLARVSVMAPDHWLLDARLYLAASRAWLSGADPWLVSVSGTPFAAPPTSLLAAAPFALLPEGLDLIALEAAIITAALLTIRLLRRPVWWLAFPPLAECLVSGQVQAFLVPLLLIGSGWVAVLIKAYAALPLLILGRWRQLGLGAVCIVLTIPILPWATFAGHVPEIASTLTAQSRAGVGLMIEVVLAPLWIAALVLVGRGRAAWLSIAVWPSPEPYYATLTMPALTPVTAAIVAAPIPGAPLIALCVAGFAVLAERGGNRVPWLPQTVRRRLPTAPAS